MNYWLFKSEPSTFSLDHLKSRAHQTEPWDGVRNYQVRNWLRDTIKRGDRAFFYHSSCAEPGIYGTVEIISNGYPDNTALDPNSKYFDPKSSVEHPRWFRVDVRYQQTFKPPILLQELRSHSSLSDMLLLKPGSRLSITPVTAAQWCFITELRS